MQVGQAHRHRDGVGERPQQGTQGAHGLVEGALGIEVGEGGGVAHEVEEPVYTALDLGGIGASCGKGAGDRGVRVRACRL